MAVLTGDMLSGIGETLHGPDWRTWLAKRLRKSERTVRRYERDETRIPAVVRDELHDVIREQITVLEAFSGVTSRHPSRALVAHLCQAACERLHAV